MYHMAKLSTFHHSSPLEYETLHSETNNPSPITICLNATVW
jgi:hypothetical protein